MLKKIILTAVIIIPLFFACEKKSDSADSIPETEDKTEPAPDRSIPADQKPEIAPVFDVDIEYDNTTSFLNNSKNEYAYHMSRAFDGNPLTSWVEGMDGWGVDESLTVYFDNIITADTIKIMPGYYDEKYYYDNNRVKELYIDLDNSNFFTEFSDGMDVKEIDLGGDIQFSKAVFILGSVYEGDKYDDTCIAEIEFYLKGIKINLNDSFNTEPEQTAEISGEGPSGMYFKMEEMDFYEYYFFPDGNYVYYTDSIWSHMPYGIPRTIGTWEYNSSTGTIDMYAEHECTITLYGSYFVEEGDMSDITYSEYYDYYVGSISGHETLDWFKCLEDAEEDFTFSTGSIKDSDYILLETDISDNVSQYIEENEQRFRELYELKENDELPPYVTFEFGGK